MTGKKKERQPERVLSSRMAGARCSLRKGSVPPVEKMDMDMLRKLTGKTEFTKEELGELQFLVDVKNGAKKLSNTVMKERAGEETVLRFLEVMNRWERFWQFLLSWGEVYTKTMLNTVLEKAVTELASRDFSKENTFSLTNIVKILAVAGKQQTNAIFQINIGAKTANEVDSAIDNIKDMLSNSPVLLKEIGRMEVGKTGGIVKEGESDDVVDVNDPGSD
ncbi:MAG: hypothetical protein DRJ03_02650 [Chloroflexi bacterium]|nr:MAG: hypothetical protein DRJ03_02650 [Chloroflexota bacterium]